MLHARGGLTGATARILAYPPLPAAVSSVSPGTEFPSGERAMDILSKLVRGARALYKGLSLIVKTTASSLHRRHVMAGEAATGARHTADL